MVTDMIHKVILSGVTGDIQVAKATVKKTIECCDKSIEQIFAKFPVALIIVLIDSHLPTIVKPLEAVGCVITVESKTEREMYHAL